MAQQASRVCSNFINARDLCWKKSKDGRNGEDCLVEELREKRCLSSILCPTEAKLFYGDSQYEDEKAPCSLWAEAFAFSFEKVGKDIQQLHLLGRESIASNHEAVVRCGNVSHRLSRCMSTQHQSLVLSSVDLIEKQSHGEEREKRK